MVLIGIVHSFSSGEETIIDFLKKEVFIYKNDPKSENFIKVVKENWKDHYVIKIKTIKDFNVYRLYPLFLLLAVDDELSIRFGNFNNNDFGEFLQEHDLLWNENRELIPMADLTIIPSKNDYYDKLMKIIPNNSKIPEIIRSSKDPYYMLLAEVIAMRANCMKRKVGCVIVQDEYKIIAGGYNGTASGSGNCNEGHCERCNDRSKNLGLDDCKCLHAECNALSIAGTNAKGCAKTIIREKIARVVYDKPFRSEEYMLRIKQMFDEANPRVAYEKCSPNITRIGLRYDAVNSSK
ncbi:16017_t:CDS:2, partial [Dentiscutata erythropus]